MQGNNDKIEMFLQAFKDDYLSTKVAYHLTRSSLETLRNVNMIIDSYYENEKREIKDVLLNIFGMLQALFVGIDALYALSYGVTNRKWSVNVNNNPQLREIKYVRNDVVGHPTKRTYTEKRIGYCDLDLDKTNYYELVYKIAIPTDKSEDIQSHHVDLRKTIESYHFESSKLLDEIYKRMLLENPATSEYFSEKVYGMYKEYRRGIRNFDCLLDIKTKYCKLYNLEETSSDRLLWRVSIIEEMFKWDLESHDEILTYLINYQFDKLYRMCNQLDELDFSGFELKYRVPKSVEYFCKFIDDNHIDHNILKDNLHPLFLSTIEEINGLAKGNKIILKVLNMYSKNKDNQTRIYALGSML